MSPLHPQERRGQTLYLLEPGLTLNRVGRYLRLENRQGQCLARYAPALLRQVFVFGEAMLTTSAMKHLAAAHVPVVFLARTGRFVARLSGPEPGTPSLRRAQYDCAADPAWVRESARAVVSAKLLAQRQMLLRQRRNHGLELDEPLEGLADLRRQVGLATSLKALRGLEGKGAALYFRQFSALLRGELEFEHRRRRPACDPVNALLSFAYSLLRAEVEGQLEGFGLDPRVGFLHVERPGRPALALDMMEEFRVEGGDRVVLRAINNRVVQAGDFTGDEAGRCRLKREATRRFVAQYGRTMETARRGEGRRKTNLRRMVHVQARELVAAVRSGTPYQPHTMRL